MVMPFIRLLAIYAAVIIGITAFFQRDRIMDLAGFSAPDTHEAEPSAEPVGTDDTDMAATVTTGHGEQPSSDPATPSKAEQSSDEGQEQSTDAQTPAPVGDVATAQPVARPTVAPDTTMRMNNARQAFWQGDMKGAEQQYRDLLNDHPDNVELNGELGNVLYSQQRFDDAAEFYFAAGKILISNGNSQQALPLFQILQGIAPERATALRTLANQ